MDIILTESNYTLLLIFLVYGCDNKIIITSDGMKELNLNIEYEVKKIKNKILFAFYLLYLRIYFLKFNKKKYKRVIGSGHLIYSNLVIKNKEFIMFEDGFRNYGIKNQKGTNIQKLKSIFGYLSPKKEIIKAKKIYLTSFTKLYPGLKEKVEVININTLWQKKSEHEKQKILHIFGLDSKISKKIYEKKYLLLTQPLSEDNILSEEEKIEIYRKILKNYNQSKVIIKPHPREKTDYKIFFPDVGIIEKKVPIELLELCGFKIEEVITIFSTGILNFKNKAKLSFYETEINSKLFKKFGSMDHIIKRNKFI